MKKVLIISYYWPPAGGGGVMRWLKMSSYLSQSNNWKPIIYTPKNAGYLIWDYSLVDEVPKEIEVVKYPIVEPNNFLDILGLKNIKKAIASGGVSSSNKDEGLKQRIILWVRSNLFIPDPRFLWVKPSVRFLSKLIKDKQIDVIVTTGPPHSMHLIGLHLKKKCNIKWVADFRDPWSFIDFFDDLKLSKRALNKHIELERAVIDNADKLVTVSPSWAKEFKRLYKRDFEIIYNGYDPNDFPHDENIELDKEFTITHIGSLNKDRNAALLWKVIGEICNENKEFKKLLKIRLIGTVTPELSLQIKELGLTSQVKVESYMPHQKVIDVIRKSQLLLLLINNTSNISGIIPGKLYEYLGADRPIICIGNPDSDSAQIIKETNVGKIVDFEDKLNLKKTLLEFYSDFIRDGKIIANTKNINKYSRKSEAMEYAELLDNLF